MFQGNVEIICQDRKALWRFGLDERNLARLLERMRLALYEEGKSVDPVQLCFLNEREIADLNRQFLGCNGPTNVLSFPANNGMPGNIFMAAEFILREARFYGQDRDEYLFRLVAHGLCHLAGMDHGEEMERLTEICLSCQCDAERNFKARD